jgi:hypothetical protein
MKSPLKLVLLLIFCVLNLTACSTIKETARGVMGISTKEVEASRGDAIKKQFNYGYQDCQAKVLKVLAHIGAYVYARDETKNLIAVYVSSVDTTVAGVFLKEVDANNTLIEVASPSTYAKEFIAEKLFSGLEKGLYMDSDEVIK